MLCGTGTIAHQSGTSIRGKSRVSPFADKRLKMLFHMAAMVAVRCDQELQQYYERKVRRVRVRWLYSML
ncbi:MAG: transposase [Flavobacteriales bacterium]|nr:transposase [Flavobacteriales bacterium]